MENDENAEIPYNRLVVLRLRSWPPESGFQKISHEAHSGWWSQLYNSFLTLTLKAAHENQRLISELSEAQRFARFGTMQEAVKSGQIEVGAAVLTDKASTLAAVAIDGFLAAIVFSDGSAA